MGVCVAVVAVTVLCVTCGFACFDIAIFDFVQLLCYLFVITDGFKLILV